MGRKVNMTPQTLEEALSGRTAEGVLYERLPEKKVRCHACAHRCRIPEGKKGVCQVRFNEGGSLRVPRGYVGALQVDPIEKKPFFHALPGARAYSFGMLGCDYHCDYCQNWITSQALRDPASAANGASPRDLSARELAERAVASGCQVMTSTYNEPLITSEWAMEVFQEARAKGLLTSYVSNGNATKEVLGYIRPLTDLYKVDLKSFNDKVYRRVIGGTLAPVLESIERVKAMGFWLEVVTLVVPGMNDDGKELKAMAKFLASVSRDIPWHVTAFHPDYRMTDRAWTEPGDLDRCWHIGMEAGLRYVYSGNRPGQVGSTENTLCPSCGETLIERLGFQVLSNRIGEKGACPKCATAIPGVWKMPGREPNKVIAVEKTPLAEKAKQLPIATDGPG
jgi:pyruvate formate lyase activating enzyme